VVVVEVDVVEVDVVEVDDVVDDDEVVVDGSLVVVTTDPSTTPADAAAMLTSWIVGTTQATVPAFFRKSRLPSPGDSWLLSCMF